MSRHMNYFMRLNCAGDILNSVDPMRKPVRRITEAVAVVKKIRNKLIRSPGNYDIFQITDGNGLESIIASHVLAPKHVTVLTTYKPKFDLQNRVENLTFITCDDPFKQKELSIIDPSNTILVITGNVDYNKATLLCYSRGIENVIIVPNMGSIMYDKCLNGTDILTDEIEDAKIIAIQQSLSQLFMSIKYDRHICSRNSLMLSNV